MIPNSNNLGIELGFILQTFQFLISCFLLKLDQFKPYIGGLMQCNSQTFDELYKHNFSPNFFHQLLPFFPSSPLLSNHLTLPLLISSFSYNSGPLVLVLCILSQKDEAKISKRNISVQLNDLLTFFFFQPGNFCSFILYCWYQD